MITEEEQVDHGERKTIQRLHCAIADVLEAVDCQTLCQVAEERGWQFEEDDDGWEAMRWNKSEAGDHLTGLCASAREAAITALAVDLDELLTAMEGDTA